METVLQNNDDLEHEGKFIIWMNSTKEFLVRYTFCVVLSGEDEIAQVLKSRVRILVWVMTQPQNHKKKAIHVKATWGKRVNTLLYMSSTEGNFWSG